jgi:uncharacterized membrane protein YkoI
LTISSANGIWLVLNDAHQFMKKLVLILLLLALFPAARAATPNDEKKLKRLPSAVRQTILDHLGDGKIDHVAKTAGDDGQANYAVMIERRGKTRGFTVATDGRLLEMEVFLEETPAAVQKTIRATAGGIVPDNISQTADDDGATNYFVEMTKAGVTRDFTVQADGALAGIQVFLPEVPAPVQKTIRATLGNATLGDITKTMDDDETNYDVEMTKDGQERGFTVGADGRLHSMQVSLAETPAAVQKTIQAELKDGRIEEINHKTEDDESVFAVRLTQGGKSRELNISPDGKVVPGDP